MAMERLPSQAPAYQLWVVGVYWNPGGQAGRLETFLLTGPGTLYGLAGVPVFLVVTIGAA